MKKTVSLFLIVSSLLGLFMFSACGKEEAPDPFEGVKTDAAYRSLAEMYSAMDALESYTVTSTSNMKFAYLGVLFSVEEEITDKVSGIGTDDFTYRREVYTEVDGGGSKVNSMNCDGYQKGYMYRRFSEDKLERKICSPISYEDYIKYRSETTPNPLVNILYDESLTATASVTEREDGGKTVTLSDFNEAFLKQFNKDMSVGGFGDLISLESLTITIEMGADKLYESSTVDYVMNLFDKKIEFTETATVSNVNSTYIKTYTFDSYTKISDIRLAEKVSRSIKEMLAADKINAELAIDARFPSQDKSDWLYEKDSIIVDRSNGFEYDITSFANGVNSKITYQNGEKRIYTDQNGTMQEVSVTVPQQLTEIIFIENLLDYGMFDPNYVTAIETNESGDIVITLDPSEAFETKHPSPSSTYYIDAVTITITMDGDNISVYQTDVEYECRYYDENAKKCTINAVCRFK